MEQQKSEDVIHTKIVGVTFNGRQQQIDLLRVGMTGNLEREPDNEYDSNAVKCMITIDHIEYHLGYIPKYMAEDFAPAMDKGLEYAFLIVGITGTDVNSRGVNIAITRTK
jgi:hypothetical protein